MAHMRSCELLDIEGVDCSPDGPGRSSDEGRDDETAELSHDSSDTAFSVNSLIYKIKFNACVNSIQLV